MQPVPTLRSKPFDNHLRPGPKMGFQWHIQEGLCRRDDCSSWSRRAPRAAQHKEKEEKVAWATNAARGRQHLCVHKRTPNFVAKFATDRAREHNELGCLSNISALCNTACQPPA